ncbi:TlpA disulfide reductase family protein [Zunongwangia pacifica]|uniref:AhpC/TSA family protein n=1 Tax=Zunongwangia pacifica TaxID=2911062 RepID=A0A9X1ZTU5_9FLAO|nr:TlpA disulfide reductase family protein [Zunongwangia pacifica]MCL6220902.1 AhpC/TSA family protein [Zunongwangia pacifica]
MNKLVKIFICTAVLTAIQCKNSDSDKNTKELEQFKISGTFKNQPDGMIYLEELDVPEGASASVDSAQLQDGHFTFTGKVDFPKWYTIKTSDTTQWPLRFVLSNEDITLNAVKDSLYKAKVTGASVNAEYQDYYDTYFEPIRGKAGPIYQLLDSLNQGGKRDLTKDERTMMDKKWEEMSRFSDSLTKLYVSHNRSSLAAPMIISERYIQYADPDKADELYQLLDPKVQSSYYGEKLSKALEGYKSVAVGSKAPAIKNQVDLEGNKIGLEDYQGKYVLVDFWASWCGPCRKENPNVLKAYNTYHSKGLEILAISLDENRKLWEKAIEKDKLPWQHVSDLKGFKNQAAQDYMVSAIPQNFLINPEGEIIATNLREEGLHEKLKEIFNN